MLCALHAFHGSVNLRGGKQFNIGFILPVSHIQLCTSNFVSFVHIILEMTVSHGISANLQVSSQELTNDLWAEHF